MHEFSDPLWALAAPGDLQRIHDNVEDSAVARVWRARARPVACPHARCRVQLSAHGKDFARILISRRLANNHS